MTDFDPAAVCQLLDLQLPSNDADASTVRGYLAALLAELWREEEGFSGKRPFGNSSWQYELYIPMAKAGLIPVELDEDDDIVDWTAWQAARPKADALIIAAIEALGADPAGSPETA